MKKFDSKLVWIVLVGFAALLFWNLGGTSLTDWDEAWYGDIARNFAQTGHFLTPIWNMRPFFDKPPLYLWFTALAIKTFGQNEFSVRFFSALASLGTGVLIYQLGKELFNKRVGLMSLIVLVSTIAFVYRGRTGNLDNFLTFWLILEMLSLVYFFKTRSSKWATVVGLAMTCAFLSKGFITFIFPAILLAGLFVTKPKQLLSIKLWTSLVSGSLIIGLWVLLTYLTNGQIFLDQFLANQIGKISSSGSLAHTQGNFSLIFVSYLKSGLKWWFILFVPAVVYSLLTWKTLYKRSILIFFVVIFGILTFSENKSDWFLTPLYPVAALVVGSLLGRLGRLGLFGGLLIGLVSLIQFHSLYLVGDSSGDEARVAKAAFANTTASDKIYLTDFYYPTTVYYSQRQTYSLFSNVNVGQTSSTWWILPQSDWPTILKQPRVFIITSPDNLNQLSRENPNSEFDLIYQSGQRMLVSAHLK